MLRKNSKKISLEGMTSFKKKGLTKAIFLLSCVGTVLIFTSNISFAGGLFDNADKLLNDIYTKFLGMSTAAAGVGVGTGVFMKKLSMGKQDKIELGNKVIKDSIIGWSTLNALGIILNFASNYTK